jgi:membrane fusion protein (multidrug efflux system)
MAEGRHWKRWIAAIGGILVVTVALAGVKAGQIVTMVRAGEAMAPPPEAVTAARVEQDAWEARQAAIGSLVAVRGVTLSAEVPGTVREISFESGAAVRRGQLLVRLDTSAEEAQLSAAQAEASLARLNLERARKLREGGASAPADLDAAEARAKGTAASVANLQALIAKKTIRAPFDGRISIRQVELGQVVSPGAPIASLQSVTPIHVDFWMPQQALSRLQPGLAVQVRTDIFPGRDWRGTISIVNPEVDVATRSVRVRATIPNDDGRLRPGMFANVEVLSPDRQDVLTIPATAVLFAPYGDSVFTLEQQRDAGGRTTTVAKQRFVRLGERRGDLVAVASGLRAGEEVVSSGAFKLRNGAPVRVEERLAPEAQASPRPPNQ